MHDYDAGIAYVWLWLWINELPKVTNEEEIMSNKNLLVLPSIFSLTD